MFNLIPKSRIINAFMGLTLLVLLFIALFGDVGLTEWKNGLINVTPTVFRKAGPNYVVGDIHKDKKARMVHPNMSLYFTPIPRGEYIKVGSLDVAIVTAVYYPNFPQPKGFNVFLNGWVNLTSSNKFNCCFLNYSSYDIDTDTTRIQLVQTPAKEYHVYKQWIVDMQNGEFVCSITSKLLSTLSLKRPLEYVAFSQNGCKNVSKQTIKIEYRKRIANSVGLCLKISYGNLDPKNMVEWFEYYKMLGVTKVFTFLADGMSEDAAKVLKYYNSTGFLEANPINPAPSTNGTAKRTFHKPGRWDQQAFVDEVMACNDCKHRMSGLDYVIVIDIDEWIVPKNHQDDLHTILKTTLEKFPKACSFSFDSHVAMLNWGTTRESPLQVMRNTNITNFPNFDGASRNTRWAFIPDRTFFVQNNKAWCKKGYKVVQALTSMYTLIHRRSCKGGWSKTCLNHDIRVRDDIMLKYEDDLIRNIRQLPLHDILPKNFTNYIQRIKDWW